MSVQLPSRFPVKQVPRVDFRVKEFRKLVATHGLDLTWEHATECPCARQSASLGLTLDADVGANVGTTHQALGDCPTCSGSGYRYHSLQTAKGVVTGATQNPDRFRHYGEMAKGMISLTVLPEHRLNLGDRITLTDSVQLYRETHTYGGEDPSVTRYPIHERELDITPAPITTGVMDVFVTDAAGIAQVGGEKVEGTDFDVVAGEVDWINPPVVGARWSISYYATPVYLVTDLPHPFRDTKVKVKSAVVTHASLPINAMCTLEYLTTGKKTG